MNHSAVKLWEQFKNKHQVNTDEFSCWAFGNSPEMADELLALVLRREKTGTSSLYQLYELEGETLPKIGAYSVILDGNEQAQAIICNQVVECLPYGAVSEVHAYLEGEGERDLAYWRSVHQPFFEKELTAYQQIFSEDVLIVYELFEVAFTK